MDYYIDNGEYWKTNTYGSTIKSIMYNNSNANDEYIINSLSDIYKYAKEFTGIDTQKWISQLYEGDFNLLGYDKSKIENNLLVYHGNTCTFC